MFVLGAFYCTPIFSSFDQFLIFWVILGFLGIFRGSGLIPLFLGSYTRFGWFLERFDVFPRFWSIFDILGIFSIFGFIGYCRVLGSLL